MQQSFGYRRNLGKGLHPRCGKNDAGGPIILAYGLDLLTYPHSEDQLLVYKMVVPKRVALCYELFVLGGLIGGVWQNCLRCVADHITLFTEEKRL